MSRSGTCLYKGQVKEEKLKNKILVLACIIAIIGLMIGPSTSLAATISGPATGSVTISSALPAIGTPTIEPLVPNTTIQLTVPVNDASTMDNIAEVWVVLKLDDDTLSDDPGLDSIDSGYADYGTCAIFKWTPSGNFESVGSEVWTVTGTAPSMTATTGTFTFNITVNKIARYATGGSETEDGWDVYIKVTDKAGTPNIDEDGPKATQGDVPKTLVNKSMAAYASVSVPSTVTFGSLSLSATDQALSGGFFTTTSIVNKAYALKVNSTDWNGSAHTLILDEDGSPGADSFSIRADDDAAIDTDTQYVTKTATTIDGHAAEAAGSTDSGSDVPVYLWVSIGPSAYATTYSGDITLTVDY